MLDKIHWLGHASFFIDGLTAKIYIDPYQIKKDFLQADIILITHEHFDHFSIEDIKKIAKADTSIVGPKVIEKKLTFPIKTISPGEKLNIKGIEIEGVPAYNLNKSFHPKSHAYLGFIITVDGSRIYHAGDTDFIPEMKTLKADIVLLPIGGTYTMDAKEAAEAANAINPKFAVPMHWGSIVGSQRDAQAFKEMCKTEVKILKRD